MSDGNFNNFNRKKIEVSLLHFFQMPQTVI